MSRTKDTFNWLGIGLVFSFHKVFYHLNLHKQMLVIYHWIYRISQFNLFLYSILQKPFSCTIKIKQACRMTWILHHISLSFLFCLFELFGLTDIHSHVFVVGEENVRHCLQRWPAFIWMSSQNSQTGTNPCPVVLRPVCLGVRSLLHADNQVLLFFMHHRGWRLMLLELCG